MNRELTNAPSLAESIGDWDIDHALGKDFKNGENLHETSIGETIGGEKEDAGPCREKTTRIRNRAIGGGKSRKLKTEVEYFQKNRK